MLTKYEIEEEKEDKFTVYIDQSELQNDAIRYYEIPTPIMPITPIRPIEINATITGPISEYRPYQGGISFTIREQAQAERSVETNISSCYIEEIEENIPF